MSSVHYCLFIFFQKLHLECIKTSTHFGKHFFNIITSEFQKKRKSNVFEW